MAEKKVNPNRFFWNPETKEKIYTEYTDGTKIELNEGQKIKAKEAAEACTKRALGEIASNSIMARKPIEKRIPEDKREKVEKEVKSRLGK